jgi:hypothetical protein
MLHSSGEELELCHMWHTTTWLTPEITFTCCALATVTIGSGPGGGSLGMDLSSLYGYFEPGNPCKVQKLP